MVDVMNGLILVIFNIGEVHSPLYTIWAIYTNLYNKHLFQLVSANWFLLSLWSWELLISCVLETYPDPVNVDYKMYRHPSEPCNMVRVVNRLV